MAVLSEAEAFDEATRFLSTHDTDCPNCSWSPTGNWRDCWLTHGAHGVTWVRDDPEHGFLCDIFPPRELEHGQQQRFW